jgi:hypothetical protein
MYKLLEIIYYFELPKHNYLYRRSKFKVKLVIAPFNILGERRVTGDVIFKFAEGEAEEVFTTKANSHLNLCGEIIEDKDAINYILGERSIKEFESFGVNFQDNIYHLAQLAPRCIATDKQILNERCLNRIPDRALSLILSSELNNSRLLLKTAICERMAFFGASLFPYGDGFYGKHDFMNKVKNFIKLEPEHAVDRSRKIVIPIMQKDKMTDFYERVYIRNARYFRRRYSSLQIPPDDTRGTVYTLDDFINNTMPKDKDYLGWEDVQRDWTLAMEKLYGERNDKYLNEWDDWLEREDDQ